MIEIQNLTSDLADLVEDIEEAFDSVGRSINLSTSFLGVTWSLLLSLLIFISPIFISPTDHYFFLLVSPSMVIIIIINACNRSISSVRPECS